MIHDLKMIIFIIRLDKDQNYKKDDECKYNYYIVNKTNEFRMSESKSEQAHIKQ